MISGRTNRHLVPTAHWRPETKVDVDGLRLRSALSLRGKPVDVVSCGTPVWVWPLVLRGSQLPFRDGPRIEGVRAGETTAEAGGELGGCQGGEGWKVIGRRHRVRRYLPRLGHRRVVPLLRRTRRTPWPSTLLLFPLPLPSAHPGSEAQRRRKKGRPTPAGSPAPRLVSAGTLRSPRAPHPHRCTRSRRRQRPKGLPFQGKGVETPERVKTDPKP